MHDISLNRVIRDYLTNEEIDETTYEEFRQALAKLLVEEKGYSKETIKPRVQVVFPIDGKQYARIVDLACYVEDKPVLLVMFCTGEVSTYTRESLAAARLFPEGPVPLVVVTDSKDALLLETGKGEILGEGMAAIPHRSELKEKMSLWKGYDATEDALEKERRILFAYTESLYGCCSYASCTAEDKGGRWQD